MTEARRLDEFEAERDSARAAGYDLTLIGRRSLRSNNSWMHNSPRLMKGADRCTAVVHPDEAAARGLEDGAIARVESRVGGIELPIEISDEVGPGIVSVPHGFGHHRAGIGWSHAATKPGVSVNDITDPALADELSGNAAFNAVPVRLTSVAVEAAAEPSAVGATS
jgi:anaerobic selenocysteine-containing dehydrogenase